MHWPPSTYSQRVPSISWSIIRSPKLHGLRWFFLLRYSSLFIIVLPISDMCVSVSKWQTIKYVCSSYLYRVRKIDIINNAFKKLCFGFCNKLLISFLHKASLSVWAHWQYLSVYIYDSLPVTVMKKIRYWLPRYGCHENQDSPSPKLFISLPLLSGL